MNVNEFQAFVFCDESKFSINNGDAEDATFYFAVYAALPDIGRIEQEFKQALEKNRVMAPVYHSSTIFDEKRPRARLMKDLIGLIISNRLHCFCFKYPKALLFEPSKRLGYLDQERLINFQNAGFQALFYFVTIFNTYLRDEMPSLVEAPLRLYFDRGVYGVKEVEAFHFPSEHFAIKQMTHVEKSQINLLALPDFIGYIFRKAKISHNKAALGDRSIETSVLTINSFGWLCTINDHGLFHFLDIDKYLDAIGLILTGEYPFKARASR